MSNPSRRVLLLVMAAVSGLAACAARPAPDIAGRWQPVNRYSAMPQEIPLRQAYEFRAAPMDRTLKAMLERWARDTRMELVYAHPSDFTLHAPVAGVRTTDLQQALAGVSALYVAQQVSLAVEDNRIVVRRADAAPGAGR